MTCIGSLILEINFNILSQILESNKFVLSVRFKLSLDLLQSLYQLTHDHRHRLPTWSTEYQVQLINK